MSSNSIIIKEELSSLIFSDNVLTSIKDSFCFQSDIPILEDTKQRILNLSLKVVEDSKNKYLKEGKEKIYNIDLHTMPLFWIAKPSADGYKFDVLDYIDKKEILLLPGEVYRSLTLEWFDLPPGIQGWIFPKTSIARQGLTVTLAPFVEPGAAGAQSLQIINHNPIEFPLVFNNPCAKLILVKSRDGDYNIKNKDVTWVSAISHPPLLSQPIPLQPSREMDIDDKIESKIIKALDNRQREISSRKSSLRTAIIAAIVSAICAFIFALILFYLTKDSINPIQKENPKNPSGEQRDTTSF